MQSDADEKGSADARELFLAGVGAVQADQILTAADLASYFPRHLQSYRRIGIVSIGKAGLALAGVLWKILPEDVRLSVTGNVVAVPRGYVRTVPDRFKIPPRMEVIEAGHPVPDAESRRVAERALRIAKGLGQGDLLIAMVSGGSSALCARAANGLAGHDVRTVYKRMLSAGIAIDEMNVVRKHLSSVSGGRLAAAAYPAEVVTLVISDVPADDPGVIGSGPTVPDESTFAEAIAVLDRYGLTLEVPKSISDYLHRGAAGEIVDTPAPGDPVFVNTSVHLLASNATARGAVSARAGALGYSILEERHHVTGEAREAGRAFARRAASHQTDEPLCLIQGGETTVTVRGTGAGGRNQEFALAAALELERIERDDVLILSGGTDGIDGPTPAAGAMANAATARRAREFGLDPESALEANDSFSVFSRIGGMIETGPTHTNVMDVQLALVGTHS